MFNMLSDCEDDLCIFVCGTCKRYFTQLSAFAQHKKEKLCKKGSGLQGKLFANNFLTSNRAPKRNLEEVDSEYADISMDSQDYQDYRNDQLRNDEENDYNSQKRKYPRKQDKTKIKRTVRDMELEAQDPYDEGADDGLQGAGPGRQDFPGKASSTLPFPSQLALPKAFGTATQEPTFCRHLIYVCKACHKEFPNNLSKPYRCCDCRRGFQTERELRVHVMRAKHNNLCDVCGKIFPDKYKLRKHTLSHVTEKNFPCDHPGCTKAFKSAEDVRTHMKYVHATEKPYKCLQCLRAFARPDKYKQHLLTHRHQDISGTMETLINGGFVNAQENYESHYPGEQHPNLSLPNAESFPRSEESNGEGLVKASDPPEVATESESITKASAGESHHMTKPRGSDDEEQDTPAFPTDEGNRVGEKEIPSSDEAASQPEAVTPRYECQNCGLRFDDVHALDQHARIHEEPNGGEQCERCHGSFRNADELLAHEERRPDHVLRCEQCSAKFLSVCDLYVHGREVHNVFSEKEAGVPEDWKTTRVVKQQKHVCGQCGKGFTRADKLRRHAVIHSPDRPCIPCPCRESHGCPLTFYRKDSLKRHALTHSLEKPFKCNMCDKTFSRQDYLTKHVTQVHKQAYKYNCTLCEYGTHEAKRLKIHIRSRHELDPAAIMAVENEIDLTATPENLRDGPPTRDAPIPTEETSPRDAPHEYEREEDELDDSETINLTEADENGHGSANDREESESTGLKSENVGMRSENSEISHGNIELRSDNLGVASGNVGIKPENVGMPSSNVGISSSNVGVSSGNAGMMSEGVVRRAGTIRGFPETVYEGANQMVNPHYGFIAANAAMSRQHPGFVYGHTTGMMSNNEAHSYGQRQVYRSDRKTPLNSVTVSAQQTSPYSGYLGNAPHNMFP